MVWYREFPKDISRISWVYRNTLQRVIYATKGLAIILGEEIKEYWDKLVEFFEACECRGYCG